MAAASKHTISGPRRRTDQRGANLVEFAIASTLLFLLIFGVIEFTGAWNSKQSMTQGVRETVRQGIVSNFDGGFAGCGGSAEAQLICQAEQRIGVDGVVVTVPGGVPTAVGEPLTISASAELNSITGIMSPFIDGRTITSSTTMRMERVESAP